jgi:hypothetical protein
LCAQGLTSSTLSHASSAQPLRAWPSFQQPSTSSRSSSLSRPQVRLCLFYDFVEILREFGFESLLNLQLMARILAKHKDPEIDQVKYKLACG